MVIFFSRFVYERPNSGYADYPTQHFHTLIIPLPVNSTIRTELSEIVYGQYNRSVSLVVFSSRIFLFLYN